MYGKLRDIQDTMALRRWTLDTAASRLVCLKNLSLSLSMSMRQAGGADDFTGKTLATWATKFLNATWTRVSQSIRLSNVHAALRNIFPWLQSAEGAFRLLKA